MALSKLLLSLDVFNVNAAKPKGTTYHIRQYARACAILAERGDIQLQWIGRAEDKEWLKHENILDFGTFIKSSPIPGIFQRTLSTFNLNPIRLFSEKPDVYHSFTQYPIKSKDVGVLIDFVSIRVPDCVPIEFTIKQARWCKWASKIKNKRWIASSNQIKSDAVSLAKINPEQIFVVELSVDSDMFTRPKEKIYTKQQTDVGIQQPFLLCVNTLNLRKNHERLIAAWELGQFAEKGWQLVLVGDSGEIKLTKKLSENIYKSVVWLRYVNREDLIGLYYSCEAIVYPSLYEGFGIPVAEAMVAGKPIITSMNTPMAEISENGNVLVDPYCIESIKNGITALMDNAVLREKYGDNNYNKRKYFKVERLAGDLLKVYRAIAQM
jgi:glycosyltransferase involved in cell wall biosynthesis